MVHYIIFPILYMLEMLHNIFFNGEGLGSHIHNSHTGFL